MCLMTKIMDRVTFVTEAAGQVYKRTAKFMYLEATACENSGHTAEIDRRVLLVNLRLIWYGLSLYKSTAPLRLKVRMLKSRGHETMLYGCVTWSPAVPHLAILRTAHHRLLFRCIGLKRKRRDGYHMLSYAGALAKRDNGAKTKDTFRRVRGSYG